MDNLLAQVKKFKPEIIRIRREIHANPELAHLEFKTSRLVARKLRSLGIEVKDRVGGTGVIGILEGEHSTTGAVVALRADMDALPIQEETNLPFKSRRKGIMHACGHDAHVAMMLGAAMLLSENRKDLNGTVKFLFQPAEEDLGDGGAKAMIRDGALKNPAVDYVFGLHVRSTIPSGTFALREGAIMASSDTFNIQVQGSGGHASRPHETIDPVFISAQLIIALQGITSRILDQTKPFVLSVCEIKAGTAANIIPDVATLQGTIRCLDEQIRIKSKHLVRKVSESICKTFGGSCTFNFSDDSYPVTYNDSKVAKKAFGVLKSINGTKTGLIEPVMGSEDFSRFAQVVPGTFYFLGIRNPKKGCVHPNHNARFRLDEDTMKYGSVSLAKLAMEFCSSPSV